MPLQLRGGVVKRTVIMTTQAQPGFVNNTHTMCSSGLLWGGRMGAVDGSARGGAAREVIVTTLLTTLAYITAVVVGVPSPLGKCLGLKSYIILLTN